MNALPSRTSPVHHASAFCPSAPICKVSFEDAALPSGVDLEASAAQGMNHGPEGVASPDAVRGGYTSWLLDAVADALADAKQRSKSYQGIMTACLLAMVPLLAATLIALWVIDCIRALFCSRSAGDVQPPSPLGPSCAASRLLDLSAPAPASPCPPVLNGPSSAPVSLPLAVSATKPPICSTSRAPATSLPPPYPALALATFVDSPGTKEQNAVNAADLCASSCDLASWEPLSLRDGDRLGAFALAQGLRCDPALLRDAARRGGMAWRDIIASGANGAQLEILTHQLRMTSPQHAQEFVSCLIWHLMDRALDRGQGFDEGAFMLDDPQHRLGRILAAVGHRRVSSHLQHDPGLTLGIDVTASNGVQLPSHHRHVLLKLVSGPANEPRLFIKTEAFGVRGAVNFAGHTWEYLLSVARKWGIGGSDTGPGLHKERIPSALRNEFAWLVQDFPGHAEAMHRVGRSGRGLGLSAMHAYLTDLLASDALSPAQRMTAQSFVERLSRDFDHLSVRIGCEVVVPLPSVAENQLDNGQPHP